MSLANCKTAYISEQDYLNAEKMSEIKHEYIDGEIRAMAGAKINHQRLVMTLGSELYRHLNGTPWEVFSSDLKVRADSGKKYFYPDVVVSCNNENGDSVFTESPRLSIEVLSDSSRRLDKTLKRLVYQNIPSLEEYVLIEQERVEIEVFRKAENWNPTYYYIDDEITFISIDLTLSVVDIYQRVDNEEMQNFIKALNETTIGD